LFPLNTFPQRVGS